MSTRDVKGIKCKVPKNAASRVRRSVKHAIDVRTDEWPVQERARIIMTKATAVGAKGFVHVLPYAI